MTFGALAESVAQARQIADRARVAEQYATRSDGLSDQMNALISDQEIRSPYGALALPAVYSSIRLIASSIDQFELTVNGGKPPEWLADPRSQGAAFDFGDLLQHCVSAMSIHGAAYVMATPRSGSGWLLEPLRNTSVSVQTTASGPVRLSFLVDGDEVQPVPYTRPTAKNAQGRYVYTDVGRRYILHIPYLVVPEAPWGLSPIQAVRATIDGLLDVERQASNLLRSGAVSGGILETDHEITPDQAAEIRDRWTAERRTGKVAVTGYGVKYRSETLSPKESQWLESRSYGQAAIAACFGIPPSYLGLTLIGGASSLNYANSQDNQRQFLRNSLSAYLRQAQDGFSTLLPRGQRVIFDSTRWEGSASDSGTSGPDPATAGAAAVPDEG